MAKMTSKDNLNCVNTAYSQNKMQEYNILVKNKQ